MSLCVASVCLPVIARADSALVPVMTTDHISAAIEEHKKSWAAYNLCAREYSAIEVARDTTRVEDREAALEDAWERLAVSSWHLCRVAIVSISDAAELLRHAADHIAAGGSWPNVEQDWTLAMHQHVATALERFAVGQSQA